MLQPLDPRALTIIESFGQDCGPDVYKMQNACETYLSKYLAEFPVELELMIAALRVGVAKRIAAHEGGLAYQDYLVELSEKFASAAHTDQEAATWAVNAWALALGKPVGFEEPLILENAGRVYEEAAPPEKERVAQTLMRLIVTAGGFLGGVLGAGMLPLVMMAIDAADSVDPSNFGTTNKTHDAMTIVAMLIVMAISGVTCGLGALGGWIFAGGNENPWASFGVAFGTAFTGVLILMFLPCFSIVFKPFTLFFSVFGTTYKSAARGGNY